MKIIFVIIPLLILLFYKRKKQIGKPWQGAVGKVVINQIPLSCQICQCNYFSKREALIPTTFLTFFGLHYFNQSGSAYVCQSCGFIHWFSRPKESEVEFIYDRTS